MARLSEDLIRGIANSQGNLSAVVLATEVS